MQGLGAAISQAISMQMKKLQGLCHKAGSRRGYLVSACTSLCATPTKTIQVSKLVHHLIWSLISRGLRLGFACTKLILQPLFFFCQLYSLKAQLLRRQRARYHWILNRVIRLHCINCSKQHTSSASLGSLSRNIHLHFLIAAFHFKPR